MPLTFDSGTLVELVRDGQAKHTVLALLEVELEVDLDAGDIIVSETGRTDRLITQNVIIDIVFKGELIGPDVNEKVESEWIEGRLEVLASAQEKR